jgi:hypothetical protein
MTTERDDKDPDATLEMPKPTPEVDEELEDIDPEQTLVREDWESTVIRRVAPHVAAVHENIDEETGIDRFGWESAGLRRLSQVLDAGK